MGSDVNNVPDSTDTDKIEVAIAEAGHDTPNYKASDEVYNALPEGCKYREQE